ncbi:2-oxoglutarate-dependent dioxygenase [Aspergillus saccharolyticus JOP 1030-1]|uniref:Clavaminate synthase-like protein n=1 Tax=Aspergillus saccharolyticus JOP 1030-1 TaxID=1450539 RepID=A0A318Z7Y6_9EURO|nr:Clavaminate synthase-like protein [Aspergillus saccharolyticus JOP 1030-1]PYH40873.1 Clavaminate synthase-like protein [Aspergillus saccharolyticus JOP 1030-1]
MAEYETPEFYPVPFPDGLPTIELQRLSLARLMNDDVDQARRLFEICTREGFFYLDLTDHPKGLKLLHGAHSVHRVGQEVFKVPMAEKYKFEPRASYETGLLDTGYKELGLDSEGNCNKLELLNISQAGFFSGLEDYTLPSWLAPQEALFRSTLQTANVIHNVILAILERGLALPTGAFTSLHRLVDRSGDFLRILHYPAPKDGKPHAHPPTPAHRDAVSVALLFCWQGGLQITDSTAPVDHTVEEPEDTWFFVPPLPGHVIVNLGLVMEVLSGNVLRAGKHRVVTPPGPQGLHDRLSVLISARPEENTPMRALTSPKIPQKNPEDDPSGGEEVLSAKEWGIQQVLKTVHNIRRQNNEPLSQ